MNLLEQLFGPTGTPWGAPAPRFGALAPVLTQSAQAGAAPAPPIAGGQSQAPAAPAPYLAQTSSMEDLATFFAGMGQGGGALLPALGAGASAVNSEAKRREGVNQTFEFLKRNGLSEGDARAAMSNPDLLKVQLAKMFTPKTQSVAPGNVIVDGQGNVIFDNSEKAKPTPEQSNFQYGVKDPAFASWLKEKERRALSVAQQSPDDRAMLAKQYGLDPESDAGRAFILTGKLPREDQQMLTATDKKAILEADENVMNSEAAIQSLERALALSKTSYDGATANERAWLTSQFGSQAGNDTRELNLALTQTALQQLKSIFGAAPTEGERKILLEIQGSAELPQPVRESTINKAIALANKRLEFNRQRAAEMRGGTFYKPQGGGAQPAPSGLGGAPIRARNAQGDVIEFNGQEWVPAQ